MASVYLMLVKNFFLTGKPVKQNIFNKSNKANNFSSQNKEKGGG